MTALNLNEYACDKCGASVGNGSVAQALVVADLDVGNGQVINLHFCRTRYEDNKKVKGCAESIMTAANLKHFLEQHEDYDRLVLNEPVKEEPVEIVPPEMPQGHPNATKKPAKKTTAKKRTVKKKETDK